MSTLTRDGTAEPISPDQILRHVRGRGNIYFPSLADDEQDWQPYSVDPYSAIHTYVYRWYREIPRSIKLMLLLLLFVEFREYWLPIRKNTLHGGDKSA